MAPSINAEKESSAEEEFVLLEEEELHGYNVEGIPPPKPEDLEALRKWLNPTNYDEPGGELCKNQNYYTPHTGKWLPESAEYKQLFASPDTGLLWIQGIPGSGKSVIAARLVNEFMQSGVPVCYFFFREIIQQNRTQRSMVIDWLSQLIHFYPPCATRLLEFTERYHTSGAVSTPILWRTFSDAVIAMRKIYIVVDALDEMDPDETNRCLSDLSELVMQKPSGIKVIATSRQNPEIQNAFKRCAGLVSLRLDRESIDNDIEWYATRRLEEAANISLDTEACGKLVNDLVAGANGLFLYARLTLDELLSSEGQLMECEERLPRGISEMYSHLLEKHRTALGVSLEMQILVLQIVIFTTKTLRLNMLASILNMQLHGEKGLDMPLLNSKALIRRICGPLLEIEDDVVHIVHHSFTEYLTNKGGVRGSSLGDFPVLKAVDAHKALCDICLTFLNFDRFQQPGDDLRPVTSGCMVSGPAASTLARQERYPFLNYALFNWGYHARNGEVDDVRIFEKMTSHLETEANVFTQIRGDGLEPYPVKFTPLHIAAAYGIKAYVLHLLESGSDVEAVDDSGKTPLMNAAQGWSLEILEVLLEHGARLDAVESRRWTPLHFAAESGRAGVVRRLLELGMSPNPDGVVIRKMGIGYPAPGWLRKVRGPPPHYTPIRLAIQKGYTEVTAELIPHLKPQDAIIQNSRKYKGKTLLHYAALNDRAEIVAQILQAGLVDVNHQDAAGRTPLLRAIQEHGTLKTVQVLLQYGADINLCYPLHACAAKKDFNTWSGFQKESDIIEIAAALLNAGVDIDSKDNNGNTPIFYAAAGLGGILQWLIEKGANVNLRNASGETPLHLAKNRVNVECLLRNGVDINAQDNHGNTALHKIKRDQYHWIQNLTLFMQHGADPYLENLRGVSAFHAPSADAYTSRNMAELMKIPGIDINAPDRFGRTILHSIYKTHSVSDLEIPPGVNLDAQDWEGNTLLHITTHAALFRSLLRAGANPQIRNRQGKLPFQMLLGNKDLTFDMYGTYDDPQSSTMNATRMKEMLAPFDINITDSEGNTALHIAVGGEAITKSELSGVIEVLVDQLGVDVTAKNNKGKTALHLAAVNGTQLPLLLKYMKGGVHDVDAKGRTPLHYAAASGCMCRSGISTHYLLDAGADAAKQDRYGRNPLHYAAQTGNANAVYLLIRHLKRQSSSSSLLPLDVQDIEGRTPLHYAARTGHYATVQCLVDSGARIDTKDLRGMTPLHQAAAFATPLTSQIEKSKLQDRSPQWYSEGHHTAYCSGGCGVQLRMPQYPRIRDVVRLLLKLGADPEAVAEDGLLPLHVAGQCGTAQVVEVLYEHWVATTQQAAGEGDIVTWAAERAQLLEPYMDKAQSGFDRRELADARFKLIKIAANVSQYSNMELTGITAKFTSHREALWRALGESDEVAVLQLLRNSGSGDFEDLVDSDTGEGEYRPICFWEKQEVPFGRRVVRFVIQQGWISVFSAVIDKFGLDDLDIFALEYGRDPNLEMLQLLLSHIRNPNIRITERDGPSSLWRKDEGNTILDVFAGSALPWHTEGVRILLATKSIVPCLKTPPDGYSKATLLHTVLGGKSQPQGTPQWVNETLHLLLECEGVDLNAPFKLSTDLEVTPLMLAAHYGKTANTTMHLETLIKAGADVNMLDPVQACLENPAALKVLLNIGSRLPDDHHKLMYKLLTLRYPANQKQVHCETLEVLLAAGLDVNAASGPWLQREAVHDEDAEDLDGWSNPEVDDVESETAKKVRGAHTGFKQFFFMPYSSDLNPYIEPHQILHDIALHGSNPMVVDTLFRCASMHVDVRDASGRTPLLIACASPLSTAYYRAKFLQPEQVAIRLLDVGASPIAVDHAGYSALDYYFVTRKPDHAREHWELFEALLHRGAANAPSRQHTILIALKMAFKDCHGPSHGCSPCPTKYIRALHVLKLLEHGINAGPHVRDSKGNNTMHLFLPMYMSLERTPTKRDELEADARKGPYPSSMGDFDTGRILDKLFRALLDHENRNNVDRNILLQANNDGETPLYAALRVVYDFAPGVFATVVEAAGGPEALGNVAPTKNGRTLLHAFGEKDLKGSYDSYDHSNFFSPVKKANPALLVGKVDAYQYLVDVVGIDKECQDQEGLTALDLASLMGHDYLVEAVGMK